MYICAAIILNIKFPMVKSLFEIIFIILELFMIPHEPSKSPLYTLYVSSIYLLYTIYIPCIYPLYALYIPSIYPLYTLDLPSIHPLSTLYIPSIYVVALPMGATFAAYQPKQVDG